MLRIPPALLLVCSVAACSGGASDAREDCFVCAGKSDSAGALPANLCETDNLLRFAGSASFEVLDIDVGLDSRAASGIADHGDFASLEELDRVPFVGPVALERLLDYLDSRGELACDVAELEEGEPNTEFLETFLFLQDNATGDCLPFGWSYFYEGDAPTDDAAARGVAEYFVEKGAGDDVSVETGLSPDQDLEPFLQSFDFDRSGLESAIGPGDYDLASFTSQSDDGFLEVMVLHYRDNGGVWGVALDCPTQSSP